MGREDPLFPALYDYQGFKNGAGAYDSRLLKLPGHAPERCPFLDAKNHSFGKIRRCSGKRKSQYAKKGDCPQDEKLVLSFHGLSRQIRRRRSFFGLDALESRDFEYLARKVPESRKLFGIQDIGLVMHKSLYY